MSSEELALRLYESLADDEQLRGSLDDDAYGPLLNWAAARASVLAQGATEEQYDELATALYDALSALVAVVEEGDATAIEAIEPSVMPDEQRAAIFDALASESAENGPAWRAATIAAVLEPVSS